MTQKKEHFDYSSIPLGYYDKIANQKKGMRSYWHHLKFKRIIDGIKGNYNAILDIGCFAGTFLGMIPQSKFSEQVGIDILENQIEYANQQYGNDFRKFYTVDKFPDYGFLPDNHFDFITLIEVIEHLTPEQINRIFCYAYKKLKSHGKLIITTPNYTSVWPLLEFFLNRFSDVKYEEQHITCFSYYQAIKKLREIISDFNDKFSLDYITTTHLFTPFIAAFSFDLADKLSSVVSPDKWDIPLGSIMLLQLNRK